MNGINLNGFGVRSFMIGGLTAKWGIGENRVPPIWDTNLIGYWDARGLPNGAVNTVANKATMEGKAPNMTVEGATMANGTLQFDGVDDGAFTTAFAFPDRYTIFWDMDLTGTANVWGAGIQHSANFIMYFRPKAKELAVFVKEASIGGIIPSSAAGLSTGAQYWTKDGTTAPYTGLVGAFKGRAPLYVGRSTNGTVFTQLGFRQLLIFNKELSQDEVNEVLTVMFPPTYAEDFTSSKWTLHRARATATVTKSEIHVTEIIMDPQFMETSGKTYANKTRVRVSGISGTGKTLYYRYDSVSQRLEITEDGIYTLPQGVYNKVLDGYNGFQIKPVGVCDITITQLPT